MTDPWKAATVVAVVGQTERARSLRLRVADRVEHRAGQHYVVRLTAPDGYVASRSYSVSSPPGDPEVELTVERLDDGEVSAYLDDVVVVGDELEVRGPIGGWFVWDGDSPAVLVGGGSGVAPLMAMLRLARREGREQLLRLVVSVRSPAELLFGDEIEGPVTQLVWTRRGPEGWAGRVGRVQAEDLPVVPDATYFVCGSAGFAETASQLLVGVGVQPSAVRVERFGPSG